MKINKKILIPVVSAFVAVIIVFLVLGLTGSSQKHPQPHQNPAHQPKFCLQLPQLHQKSLKTLLKCLL